MMTLQPKRPLYAAGIIETYDHHVLLALPPAPSEAQRRWQFPRTEVRPGEAPEKALRRLCRDTLGIDIEIVIGQPPILAEFDGVEVEMRYFLSGVVSGEPQTGPYEEIRLIRRGQLREYYLDHASEPVAEWLLEYLP